MLKVEKDNENRSLKTKRLFPTANKPDPMPQNLAFLFTKITPEPWNAEAANPWGCQPKTLSRCQPLSHTTRGPSIKTIHPCRM